MIVLDRMLPGMTGDEVLATLRNDQSTHEIPVLMLTARREEHDRVRGLALGADDYLTKPFSTQELVLRIGAILRRARVAAIAGDVVSVGPLVIDRAHHRVSIAGRHVELTATEFKLLLTLAMRRGRVQSRAQLLEDVWEAAPDVQTRTVDMHVQRLRAKLGTETELIETIRGFGYRLRVVNGSSGG
jgi:two-component system phosphate regulon response regulator PhoB